MYKLNFDKIKSASLNVTNNHFNGVFFDENSEVITSSWYFLNQLKNKKYLYPPIKLIDETENDHFTQILFILKESFTDSKQGFIGWYSFNKIFLESIIQDDNYIYLENWHNGKKFLEEMPDKINYFIDNYCIKSN